MKLTTVYQSATFIALTLFTATLIADESVNDASTSFAEDNMAGNLIQTSLGLLFILILIGAAAWAIKRFGNLKVGAQGKMKVVGGISLGARERVILLEVGDQQLVLGIAPGQISTLHVMDEPVKVEATAKTGGGFAERLSAVMKGQNPNRNQKS